MQKVHAQKGAVLIVSLILLMVLTLIGVSGAQSVIMGERMTFASRDAKVALEVAESMARRGELVIDGLADTSGFGTTGWMRTAGDGPDDLFAGATWTDTNTTEIDVGMTDHQGNALKGRMYIEMSGLASDDSNASDVDLSTGNTGQDYEDIQVFKIVTRGVGVGGTERIIVTFYGRSM